MFRVSHISIVYSMQSRFDFVNSKTTTTLQNGAYPFSFQAFSPGLCPSLFVLYYSHRCLRPNIWFHSYRRHCSSITEILHSTSGHLDVVLVHIKYCIHTSSLLIEENCIWVWWWHVSGRKSFVFAVDETIC